MAMPPLLTVEEFEDETNPVYKCPACRWVFSPAPTLDEQIRMSVDLLRVHAPWLLAVEAPRS